MVGAPRPHDKPGQITFKETVYYAPYQGPSRAVDIGYTQWVGNQEDAPYERPLYRVGPEWRSLDHGWITDPGVIVIENTEGYWMEKIPELQEAIDIYRRIVEVKFSSIDDTPALYILPGGSQRLNTIDANNVFVRCRNGLTAKCKLTVLPK